MGPFPKKSSVWFLLVLGEVDLFSYSKFIKVLTQTQNMHSINYSSILKWPVDYPRSYYPHLGQLKSSAKTLGSFYKISSLSQNYNQQQWKTGLITHSPHILYSFMQEYSSPHQRKLQDLFLMVPRRKTIANKQILQTLLIVQVPSKR